VEFWEKALIGVVVSLMVPGEASGNEIVGIKGFDPASQIGAYNTRIGGFRQIPTCCPSAGIAMAETGKSNLAEPVLVVNNSPDIDVDLRVIDILDISGAGRAAAHLTARMKSAVRNDTLLGPDKLSDFLASRDLDPNKGFDVFRRYSPNVANDNIANRAVTLSAIDAPRLDRQISSILSFGRVFYQGVGVGRSVGGTPGFAEGDKQQPNAEYADRHPDNGGDAHVSGPRRGDPLRSEVVFVVLSLACGFGFLAYALKLGLRGEGGAAAFSAYVGAVCVTLGVCLGAVFVS